MLDLGEPPVAMHVYPEAGEGREHAGRFSLAFQYLLAFLRILRGMKKKTTERNENTRVDT